MRRKVSLKANGKSVVFDPTVELRRIMRELRKLFPTRLPVKASCMKTARPDCVAWVNLAEVSKGENHHKLYVARDLCYAAFEDSVIHEYAHVLEWEAGLAAVDQEHSDRYWTIYGMVFRTWVGEQDPPVFGG